MTANREREVHIRGSSKTETYPEPGSSVPTNDRFLSGLPRQLGNHLTWVVGVEKLAFPSKQRKLGDGKCLGDPRKSFIEHPGAILFWRIS
jgi:hypothetical protein